MNLKHLQSFVAVAEELHFGRAAQRLNIVQPAVSLHVQQLEANLGVRLFDRSSRHVTLTDAGRVYADEARLILKRIELAGRLARDAENGVAGDLSIGFVDNALWAVLPGVVRDFRAQYPLVELDLRQISRNAQMDAVASGQLDVGIVPSPVVRADLTAQQLVEAPLHVILPRDHHLCALKTVPLAALAKEPFVAFPSAANPRRIDEIILERYAAAGITPILAQPVRLMQTALALVSAGFGVAFVPPWMSDAWTRNVEYRPVSPHSLYSLALILRAQNSRPAAKLFAKVAESHIVRLRAAPDRPAWLE